MHFVNADLIASGLSLLKPEFAAIAVARTVLREIDRPAAERADFAFETTFSGLPYVRGIQAWKQAGYRIEMVYLRLRSTQLAVRRIAVRVRHGGHHVSGVGRALRRAAKDAQKTARMDGTPLYVWENGKVVAKKPDLPWVEGYLYGTVRKVFRRRLWTRVDGMTLNKPNSIMA